MKPGPVGAGWHVKRYLFKVLLALCVLLSAQPNHAAWWDSPGIAWLLSRPAIDLTGASFRLPYPDDPARFIPLEDVEIALKNRPDGRTLTASARLADAPLAKVELHLDMPGERPLSAWDGNVDLVLRDFPFEHLAGALALPARASPATVSLVVKSLWERGELRSATGDVTFETMAQGGHDTTPRKHSGGASFALQRQGDKLLANISNISLKASGLRSTAPSATVEIDGDFSAARPRVDMISAHAEFLPLAIVKSLAQLLPEIQPQRLSAATPQLEAGVREIAAVYRPSSGASSLQLSARIENLKLAQRGWQPALEIHHGKIQIRSGQGELRILGGAFELVRSQSFDLPVRMNARGSLKLIREEDTWRAVTDGFELWDDTLDAVFSAHFHLPPSGEPQFDVKLTLLEADIAASRSLIPKDLLHPELTAWLDRSLLGGQVTSASIEISSERDGTGYWPMVKAQMTAIDGRLNYAPGWPPVTDALVRLDYAQGHLRLRSDDAHIAGAAVRNVVAEIDDIGADEPLLNVRGEAVGSIQQGVKFIENSPLAARFKHVLDNVRVAGPARLDLGLGFWLGPVDRPLEVVGRVQLRQSRLNLVPALREGVKDVRGILEFDADSLSAPELKASYLGQPIELSVRSEDKLGASVVTIAGTASSRYLGRHLANAGLIEDEVHRETPLVGRMLGDSAWLATIEVPHTTGENIPDVTLTIESDLRGMGLELPPPLEKAAAIPLPLRLRTIFRSDQSRSMTAQLGSLVGATLEIKARDAAFALDRGLVRFGVASPPEPLADSIVRIDGNIGKLDFGDWYALLESAVTARGEAGGIPAPRAGPALAQVDEIEVSVEQLELFDIPLQNLRVRASRDDDGRWLASLLGSDLLGEVVVPADPGSQPVVANFDRLALPTVRPGETATVPLYAVRPDPSRLPALHLTCRQCQIGTHELGVVKFNATPVPGGLRIEKLYVLGSQYEARATGTWLRENGEDQSALNVEVHSDDLSALLGSFGYASKTTAGGATNIVIKAQWPGSPADFNLEEIEGILHFRSSRGRLLTVSPGATGRVFGLLMLPRLPRRLFLDFSDLFSQGLEFDFIEGSFSIDQGDAYTNNFVIDSPSARIDVVGRTGLVDETYDQVIAVTPKLSASLPFAPVWLAEKLQLLRHRSLDQAFTRRYTVTGSWKDPKVEVIQPPDIDSGGEQPGS